LRKILILLILIKGLIFAGITSDTSMSIATVSIPNFIEARMKVLINQANDIKDNYTQNVLQNTKLKNQKLENIKYNQEKINQIEVLK
jgi:hypothetical protein